MSEWLITNQQMECSIPPAGSYLTPRIRVLSGSNFERPDNYIKCLVLLVSSAIG